MAKFIMQNANSCAHQYVEGTHLQNVLTNGRTTIAALWAKGEGLYASTKARLVYKAKCKHCGCSRPTA